MDTPPVTRHSEAQSFSTAPTEVMTFLAAGDQSSPDIVTERLAPGDGPPNEDHFAFSVSDVDGSCHELRARGFAFLVEPRDYPWGRSAYLRDPDGRLVELSQTGP